MVALISFLLNMVASLFKSKSRLEAENAALCHPLIVLRRKVRGRVPFTNRGSPRPAIWRHRGASAPLSKGVGRQRGYVVPLDQDDVVRRLEIADHIGPAVQPNDDEGIEQVEANGRHNEQIHGGNVWRVVTQKGAPSLTWRPAPLDHVLGDARLRDFKPEF